MLLRRMICLYVEYWANLAQLRGRTSRRDCWLTLPAAALVFALFSLLMSRLGSAGEFLLRVGGVASVAPTLALLVRRMHDTGRDGWYALIPVANVVLALHPSDDNNAYGPVPRDDE